MRQLSYLFVLLLLGCASLGLEPAKTFDQRLAYAYAEVASIRTAATNALNTGAIKVEDAKQVQTLADQARAGLDGARGAMTAGDTKTALGRLQAHQQHPYPVSGLSTESEIMNIAQAIIALANITSAGITLLQQAQAVSDIIRKANEEGRSELTETEWALITGADDNAREALESAIRAHGG